MTLLEITKMGNPILRKIADQVSTEEILTKPFQDLIDQMENTMEQVGGVGIAAPQVGVSKQLALIKIPSENQRYPEEEAQEIDEQLIVFINPTVHALTEQVQGFWEGCLSVPGLRGYVERPKRVRVDFIDREGQNQSVEADGFLAVVFQHELDHLQGKLYVDKVAPGNLAFDEEFAKYIAPQLQV